jgi:hypothetical protein
LLPALGSPFRVGRAPYPLAVDDFNADGKPDVATPDVQGDSVTVLFGDGRGSFAPPRTRHTVSITGPSSRCRLA